MALCAACPDVSPRGALAPSSRKRDFLLTRKENLISSQPGSLLLCVSGRQPFWFERPLLLRSFSHAGLGVFPLLDQRCLSRAGWDLTGKVARPLWRPSPGRSLPDLEAACSGGGQQSPPPPHACARTHVLPGVYLGCTWSWGELSPWGPMCHLFSQQRTCLKILWWE